MKLTYLKEVLNMYGKYVVKTAKRNLVKDKKDNTGALYTSIKYKIKKHKDTLTLIISMLGYGTFVDKGVKGAETAQKAPKSPYKFGKGNKSRGTLRGAINKWVTQKKELKNIRDKQGRFIPRKSLQFLIVRSIWTTGLKTTLFFTKPLKRITKKNDKKIMEAFIKDFAQDLKRSIIKNKNIS
tara:strand:+ start:1145 stop:1690 length:546 start_codon:yes stop_codon:yes gene_type:complete